MRSCMRAYATVQKLVEKLLCHETIANLILSLARASCRLLLPPAQLLSRLNPSPDAVRSRNLSKSTLAHDAVATAVSHKHHSIICVGAGLLQFVYKLHSRLATELTLDKVLFSPWFLDAVGRAGSLTGRHGPTHYAPTAPVTGAAPAARDQHNQNV